MKVIRGKKTDRKSGETHRVIRKSNLAAVGIIGMLGICMLSGCSLADKTKVEPAENDSLVGVFVTTERLGTVTDVPCEIDIDAGTLKITDEDIDVDGCYMIYARSGEGEDMYETLVSDGISVGTNNVGYNENADGSVTRSRTVNGCVYYDLDNKDSYADSDGDVGIILNNVYEKTDGTYYITSGSSMGCAATDQTAENGSGAMDVKESYKTTSLSGSESSSSDENEMVIHVEWKFERAGEKYTFTAMSEDNKELDAQTYDVGDIPDTIKFDCDWQYVIVSYADVTGKMHSSFVDKEDSVYEYSVSTGKFFLDTGVVEIE